MKITKFTHACILIEDQNLTILIDPGNYATLKTEALEKLDHLLITHEHPDHCFVPLIKELTKKFPQVKLITNSSVSEQLKREGISSSSSEDDVVKFKEITHEDMLGHKPPNLVFSVLDKVTHPGDSHHFESNQPILCLPVQAPWGSYADALKLAVQLKPKIVIPIHDWHWRDEARNSLYQRAVDYLKPHGIEFKTVVDGELIEL